MSTEEQGMLVRLEDTDLTLANEADDVRGRTVVDSAGDEIGKVDGLFIDRQERRVRFLEMASGGILGIGEEKRLIPVDAVTDVDADTVHIDTERRQVAGGPGYDPELALERRQFQDVYDYYGYSPYWAPGYLPPRFPFR